ncbi:MAG TPA: protein translocase SEC61 complex subunit gamma [Candidatus Nanoarchaeia archaeon]|nr:protein translocase SEC61 complex subunit gamma [Candidatus Nanoarchaeia archaeon]
MEEEIQPQQSKFKRFIKESVRVMRIIKKPNKVEYVAALKVTGLGIAIIGALGFIIFLLRQYLF